MAGGAYGEKEYTSSVVSLLPRATAWIEIGSLPRALFVPRASVVGGKMRLIGGQTDTERPNFHNSLRKEVIVFLE